MIIYAISGIILLTIAYFGSRFDLIKIKEQVKWSAPHKLDWTTKQLSADFLWVNTTQ